MPLIHCETNLILTWSANCFIKYSNTLHATTFAITDAKLYVPVTLSSGFKRIIKDTIKAYFS